MNIEILQSGAGTRWVVFDGRGAKVRASRNASLTASARQLGDWWANNCPTELLPSAVQSGFDLPVNEGDEMVFLATVQAQVDLRQVQSVVEVALQ
ncbi:hypothetical protein [Curtobacterium sp. MCSS17_011]|uniref:hypothetical protein n=1 Tax=Curtobacterium sp. MCSS17_011 TaxID=2175643 RepID=UPI000DA10FF5|nr:hypothetical protein [Curtobacterium sp. MCSS17_011]